MPKPTLSENESKTLLGLVKFPDLNDRQISEIIEIKMSTVTAIKNRLKDMGFFMTVRVPHLHNMGAEVLSITYARTDSTVPDGTQLDVGKQLVEGFDEIFYVGAGPRHRFSMSIHHNYSSACRVINGLLALYSRSSYLVPGDHVTVHLPFDQTKVYNFFDHSKLLEQTFGTRLPDRPEDRDLHDGRPGTISNVKLSRIERKVLRGLIQNPDQLDSNISKRIDVTRQSVTKMRKRFTDLDLFHTLRIPNLNLLGFELLALIHTRYKPTSTLTSRADALAGVYDELPLIFKADSDPEGVELVATQSYRELERYMDWMTAHLRDQDAIEQDPTVLVFTFPNFIAVKNHVYVTGLSRIIEQD